MCRLVRAPELLVVTQALQAPRSWLTGGGCSMTQLDVEKRKVPVEELAAEHEARHDYR